MKLKSLKDVQKYLQAIPNINRGGCGIAALAMYRWLKKNDQLEDSTFIVYEYDGKFDFEFVSNCTARLTNQGGHSSASHAYLFHKGEFIDCDGNYISKRKYRHVIKDENFIVKSLNNLNEWNFNFRRKENLSWISQTLDVDLSDVKA